MNLSLHQAARILQAHWFPSGTVHPDLLDHLKDADFHSHPADIGVALALEALIEATQPHQLTLQKGNFMTPHEQAIEADLQRKGLTAARITPEQVDAEIIDADYHVFPGSCLTVCCLTLRNGFTVTGQAACASPENFDEAIGRTIARKNAREKIWPLLGFRLRDQLSA